MTVSLAFQSVLSALPVTVETASNVTARLRVSKEFFLQLLYNFVPRVLSFNLGNEVEDFSDARNRVLSGCLLGHPQSQRGFLKTLDQNKVDSKRSFDFSRISRGIGQLLSPKSYLRWFPNTIKMNTLLRTFIMS